MVRITDTDTFRVNSGALATRCGLYGKSFPELTESMRIPFPGEREREREREVISFVANQRALALVLCFFICIVGVPLWILHHCWFLERKQFFQQTLGMGIVGKQDDTKVYSIKIHLN